MFECVLARKLWLKLFKPKKIIKKSGGAKVAKINKQHGKKEKNEALKPYFLFLIQ